MDNRIVEVPADALFAPDLTASAKVVWIALRLDADAGPAALGSHTGLSRHTVLRALRQVRDTPDMPGDRRAGTALRPKATGSRATATAGKAQVDVPTALLADRTVKAQGKVLYGLLQLTPGFSGQSGEFTYTSLCALTQLSRNTLKRAVRQLIGAQWMEVSQENRLSPIRFTLGSPALRESLAEAAVAARLLDRARAKGDDTSIGQALAQGYLSALIDSNQFTDNARPGTLINPRTKERLEYDRLYPFHKVAFEYHGDQHDRPTAKFSKEQVEAQQFRDLIKAGLSFYQGIQLIVIRAEDLSVQGMLKKIGGAMPLRDLAGHEPLIRLLEERSRYYRAKVEKARKAGT